MTPGDRSKRELKNLPPVAGNGLLDRRALLRGVLAGAMTGYAFVQSASAQQLADDQWSLGPGTAVPDYQWNRQAWASLMRVLLSSNEFVTLD